MPDTTPSRAGSLPQVFSAHDGWAKVFRAPPFVGQILQRMLKKYRDLVRQSQDRTQREVYCIRPVSRSRVDAVDPMR
ncbi:hypothetical protein EGJ55_09465 [Pseudomonas moraviensis]|nr:hypothetical protein EGJ55_09465 [Pseudomonas moraviensis]